MGNPAGSNRWGLAVYGPEKLNFGPDPLSSTADIRPCGARPFAAPRLGGWLRRDRDLPAIGAVVVRPNGRGGRSGRGPGAREHEAGIEHDQPEREIGTDGHRRAPQHAGRERHAEEDRIEAE